MSDRLEHHKIQLAESRTKLNAALDQIGNRSEEQLYSDGAQWTLRQLAIHLALADAGHNQMLYHYTDGKDFIPADYDINRYNKGSVARKSEMTMEQIRESLNQSRQELLAWFDAQADDSFLDKTGRHPNMKILTNSEIINVMVWHEGAHSDDILAMVAPVEE